MAKQMMDIFIIGNGSFGHELKAILEDIGHFHVVALLGPEQESEIYDKEVNAVIAIGHPGTTRKLAMKKEFSKCSWPSIIHPSASFNNTVTMGKGNIIMPGCIFTANVRIGDFNIFNAGVVITHNNSIGSFNNFCPGAVIAGNCDIGDGNFIGINMSTIQGISIGDNNRLGAGAVLINDIEHDGIYVGVPANRIN